MQQALALDRKRAGIVKCLTCVALLSVLAATGFAQSFDPENGTGNVLTIPREAINAARPEGSQSFAKSRKLGSPRVPQPDSRQGTSKYPFGPGVNFPYPDRPYGDPDHW